MKTIILDFDGTIADSFKLSVNIAYQLTGHSALLNQDQIKELKNDSLVEVAKKLEVPKYMWPFLIYRGRRLMSKSLDKIKPFDGMPEVIAKLRKKGYRFFIVSTNSNGNIKKFLKIHGMQGNFSKIYGSVGLFGKTAALRKILKVNKLLASQVIYVGDEVRDIEAAGSIGIQTVAVTWGYNDAQKLKEAKPKAIVRTRPELLKELEVWWNS